MTSQRAFPFLQAPGREADAAHSALDCPTDALAVADIDSAALDSALRDADALGEQACDAADCDWADSQGPDLDEVPFLLSEEERGLRSPEEMGVRARQLAEDFSAILGSPIRLTVTDNRSSMFSFREPRGELMTVRLHHMFLDAPPSKRILLFLQLRFIVTKTLFHTQAARPFFAIQWFVFAQLSV